MALAVSDGLIAAVADLESHDPEKVRSALAVVAASGEAGVKHLDAVLDTAKSNDASVKAAALEAVGALGKGSTKAVPVLEAGLQNIDPSVRRAAAQGLGLVKAEGSISKLSPLIQDTHMLVRNAAMAALAALGDKAGSEAGKVAGNLRAPILREDALRALGRMGKDGAAHANEMAIYLEDSDHSIRLAVAQALKELGDLVPESVVEKAGSLLDHNIDRYRATAAVAVGSCGMAKAGKYVVKLKRMLRENVLGFTPPLLAPNCAAAVALGRLGTEGPLLAGYLKSKTPRMRAAVCQALSELGKEGLSHATAVAACLEDEEVTVRQAAYESLEAMQKYGSLDGNITASMKVYAAQ